MQLTPKDIHDLRVCLGNLPGDMKVETDPDTGVVADTVGALRALATWPPGLVVETPRERYPEATVKISKSSNAMPRDGTINSSAS